MKVLLTGATGFIGQALSRKLLEQEHVVYAWVRDLARAQSGLDKNVHCFTDLEEIRDVDIDALINLAGEPIADKRWTVERKQRLLDSRVGVTQHLYDFFSTQKKSPAIVLSGSAIGYYGSQDRQLPLTESSDPVDGFSHTLCQEWEQAAMLFTRLQSRVCLLRTGIVLGKGGGALAKLLPPFRLGLGGPIGNGSQVMSWIHINDWINACLFLLSRSELSGPFNFVSPNPVDNGTFARALARTMRRPAFFRVPCFLLKMMLGDASELLCEGQRVIPEKLLFAGYRFEYEHLEQALTDCV